jgi:membrane peptidoglycan carboxypeptidase
MQSSSRRPVAQPVRGRPTNAGYAAMAVFAVLAAIGFLGAIVVVGGYVALARDLKSPRDELARLPAQQESVVYDRTGKIELARFGDIHREIVTYDKIPPILLDATTAVEDQTFWTNTGFDPVAIVAAGLDAVRGNARGASTITQQLVRQRLLDPTLVQTSGRTAERKLKEIVQSIRLTQEFSGEQGKEEILTAYLNQNFYGNDSYGVKAAAKSYFGKDITSSDPKNKLTLAQAAILAALPQSPSNYDLVRNADDEDGKLVVPQDSAIVQRRNRVLDLLAKGRTPKSGDEYSAADFEAAKSEEVVLAPQVETQWKAPHFVWAVRDELTRELCGDESQTCTAIDNGGLKITTTLDVNLQKTAEKWVKAATIVPKSSNPKATAKALGLTYDTWMQRLRDKDLNNGALVAIDYQTGELVAYVGSADYYAKKASKQFQPKFDVVGDGYRQPGSAFKPFNYLTGIDDKKITAATMFMDVATDFGGNYTPSDADNLERGPVRMRSALQFSLNIPSVKAVAVNTPDHVFQRAQDFGMQFQGETTKAGLSLALGVQEVRPVDLVNAYATLANGGSYIPHTTILRVQDQAGNDVVAPRAKPEAKRVASREATAIVTDVLSGNTDESVNPFWGKFKVTDGGRRRPATLKTGTNNDAKDLNAYGFIAAPTADGRDNGEHALAVGVWNGNSDNTVVSTPQHPVFSIDVSTYVWQGFMNEATKGWKINDFNLPDTLVTAEVDPWTGLKAAPGQQGVKEIFIRGTAPTETAGASGGVCGQSVLEKAGFETKSDRWLSADRDWLRRAQRGPGVAGGPEGTRTSYFYNGSFTPFGRSWGPILNGGGCATPEPSPSCFPVPTPDAEGNVPSFEIPAGSGPAPQPCEPVATPSQEPSESPSPSPSVTPSASPPPTEPPVVTPSPVITEPPPTKPPVVTPPPVATPSPDVSPAAVPSPAGAAAPSPSKAP